MLLEHYLMDTLSVMDIQMQRLDGMTAAEIIRRQDPEVILIFITNMAQYGINTVYLHVRAFDDAFWKSSSFRASGYVGGDESLTAEEAYPFDPAGVFLEEAANLGISVHAWINPYRVSRSYYLDPADPGTLERIMTAVYELLDLGFDGIHMDDYFYHAPSGYRINDQ